MRETFSTLLQEAKNLVTDPSSSSAQSGLSDTETFLKKQINLAVRDLQSRLQNHTTQRVSTASTVADQQYYYLPSDVHSIEAITVSLGGRQWPIQPVEIDKWLSLNYSVYASSNFPTYYFRREKDFGIWPIPGASGSTITLYYNRIFKDMTATDYTTGTITLTNNSAAVTGSGTAFTSAMVGRYLQATADGSWYRILSYTSATSITLENVFQGTTASSLAYTIGESPEIPEQMHSFIPYYAAGMYYSGNRRDPQTGQTMLNYYYTGDFNNSSRNPQDARSGTTYWINWYNAQGRSTTGLTSRGWIDTPWFNDQFSSVTYS